MKAKFINETQENDFHHYKTLKRMEGLTAIKDQENFVQSVKNLRDQLIDEGWFEEEIPIFFQYLINKALR